MAPRCVGNGREIVPRQSGDRQCRTQSLRIAYRARAPGASHGRMAPPTPFDPDFRRGSGGFRARRLYSQIQLFAGCRICGPQRAGFVVPRPGAASASGRCDDPAHRSRPPNPSPSPGFARLGRKPGMAWPRALCRVVHARTVNLYPDDLLACAPGAARPADAAARRRVSSVGQGLVLSDGCCRRRWTLCLCAGVASADTLGASAGNAARR